MCLLWLQKSKKASGWRQGLDWDLLNMEGLGRSQQGRISGQQEMSTACLQLNEEAPDPWKANGRKRKVGSLLEKFRWDMDRKKNQVFWLEKVHGGF